MTEQTDLDSPLPATGAWMSEVDLAEDGTYLVIRSDDGEPDVFICDGDGAWIDYREFAEQDAPKFIARIRREVLPV